MKIEQVYKAPFHPDIDLVTILLCSAYEWIAIDSNGNVGRYNLVSNNVNHLFHVSNSIIYQSEEGDIDKLCSIYAMDDTVVVVNNYKTHGDLYIPGRRIIDLWRKNYHADSSKFPIALLKEASVPYIIYAVDWNRIEIMNLDTFHIVTAAKSNIHIDAEKRHFEALKYYPDDSVHPWPRHYDYFFGELHMSPDNRHVLSKGWVWGSQDRYVIYDVSDFMSNHFITDIPVDQWEHCTRGACWIDNSTIAVAFNARWEGEDGADENCSMEIFFYSIESGTAVLSKKITLQGIIGLFSEM